MILKKKKLKHSLKKNPKIYSIFIVLCSNSLLRLVPELIFIIQVILQIAINIESRMI